MDLKSRQRPYYLRLESVVVGDQTYGIGKQTHPILHATARLIMKLKRVSIPDGDNDLASDLNNLKNEDNAKVNNADKCKLDDRELKLATNAHDNSKNEPKHATNGANTSEHNSDLVSNDADRNSNATSNGEDVVSYDTTVTKHLNSNSNTVTLLGQSVERLQSTIKHEPNSYKDNDDLDDSNPGSLLVENTAERRNGGSYGSAYLHQFKDDKDCSSSSCSSSIHGPGELEDDSAQMVLRLSEDESGTFATSPIPTASVDMLLNQPDQVQGDLCKMGDAHLLETDQEKTNNLSPVPHDSNTVENTNSYNKVDEIKNSTDDTELATDKCSVHSDDQFDDLLCSMSSKEIELTKKNNDGVTVSELRKEIEDFLKSEKSISSEDNEKPVHNTEVSTENVAKSDNNANSSLTSENDETANTTNSDDISKNVLQTPDTEVTNGQVEDNDDAKKNAEVSPDIEKASESTIVISSVSSDTDPARNDGIDDDDDDDDFSVEIDPSKDEELSSGEILMELIADGTVSKTVKPEILVVPDEVYPSDKQENDEQNTSEADDSDESIKILTISEISGLTRLDTTATDDCGLNATETLVVNDKNEIVEESGDKVNNCVVVSDIQIDDVEENTEGNNSRSSFKRCRENSDEDIDLKKLKTEQPIKNEECPAENTEQSCKKEEYKPEKTEQLTEVQNTTSVTEQTGKRTLEKEVNDSKKLKLDNTSSPIKNLRLFHQFMMRKRIRRLSRRDLEEFAVQKICESFNQHSEIAELLREIRIKDRAFEALRAKYTTLEKQITDLDIVQTRISNEMRKVKDPREVVPVKITRSVGLQVSLQPLKTKANLPALVPHVSDPLVPITVTGPVKKKPQRAAATANRVSVLPPPPPALTPAPAHIRPPPVPTGKGIKTILPKISNSGQMRDESNSLLGNILQKSPTSNNNAATATLRRPAGDNVKVIDLTDEDDSNRASTSTGTQSGNIRVVAPHQLTNSSSETVSPLVTTNIPRLTYLVQSPGQQGQSVLLATTNAPTRPGQARPTLMFKPVVPQGGQKLNLVRPAVPGGAVAVLPSSLGSSGVCKYVTTTYAPGLTRSPALSTRAIAPASRHPAPLPGPPAVQASQPSWKLLPPKPALKITLVGDGIVLSWRILNKDMSLYEEIASYQLYAYQETSAPPTTEMWRKVGDVKALALPMACTLTQFTDGNKYHFAVRGVDVKTRVGPFSTPEQITLPAQ